MIQCLIALIIAIAASVDDEDPTECFTDTCVEAIAGPVMPCDVLSQDDMRDECEQ